MEIMLKLLQQSLVVNKIMDVLTKIGYIPRNELEVFDTIREEPNARVFITEWRYKGEVVRCDANVNILSGVELNGQQEKIG